MQYVSASSRTSKKTPRNRHQEPQNRSPDRPRGLQNPPRSVPKSEDAFQDQPKGAQERPKGAQDAPKRRPRAAHRRPRAPKTRQRVPRRLPEPSKIEARKPQDQFSARSWWDAMCERLMDRFFVLVSACAPSACMLKTYEKPSKNCGFCTYGAFSREVATRTKKLRKIRFWSFQNAPRACPNPPTSTLEHAKVQKKTAMTDRKCPKDAIEPAKNEKKAPKSEKRANMVPTWLMAIL